MPPSLVKAKGIPLSALCPRTQQANLLQANSAQYPFNFKRQQGICKCQH